MSRTTEHTKTSLNKRISQTENSADISHQDQNSRLIKASNSGLLVAQGYELAVIDKRGKIVKKGISIGNQIFEELSAQVIKSFCARFKGFTDADFK
ncbi:hypothetical protein [Lacimicrobium alkaliphilum]|uniref:Uncharacterized protein n=1 Tax=Lacimicrobium alkaliphilum TaxID=1526571 RepID=A0A0U2QKL8_9ALTE|nr:hypothetical protein [Lacimicrobium alkaliphilum]ALS97787.1 hypothetical protein AT746_05525 [Lacimicrobium alkaliphilum]